MTITRSACMNMSEVLIVHIRGSAQKMSKTNWFSKGQETFYQACTFSYKRMYGTNNSPMASSDHTWCRSRNAHYMEMFISSLVRSKRYHRDTAFRHHPDEILPMGSYKTYVNGCTRQQETMPIVFGMVIFSLTWDTKTMDSGYYINGYVKAWEAELKGNEINACEAKKYNSPLPLYRAVWFLRI